MLKNIFNSKFCLYIGLFSMIIVAGIFSTKISKTFAQEKEATQSGDEAVNVDLIKQRLLKSQVMGRQAGEKKHAKVGKIIRATSEAITIETTDAETVILPLTEALLLNHNEEAIGVDKVVIDSWMTALGYIDESNNFDPLYLIVAEESLEPKTQVVTVGSISELTARLLTIQPRISPETSTDFSITKNTQYQDFYGNEATFDLFETDMQSLVVGYSEDDKNEALVIRSLAPSTESENE